MGTGRKVNLAIEECMLRTSCDKPASPPQNKYTPTMLNSKKVKATGNPEAMRIIKQPKIISNISHQSKSCSSLIELRLLAINYLL